MAYKVLKDLVPFADLDYYTSTHPVMESPSQVGFRDHPTRITILPIATQPLYSFCLILFFIVPIAFDILSILLIYFFILLSPAKLL